MKTSWTNGLDEEQAKEVRSDFKGSFTLRKRLIELLNDKVNVSTKASRSKDGYASPNWPYMQADAVGYERALNEVISLISDDNVEK
jgi:hypothetical protein